MIDRAARNVAADLIERFVRSDISNDELSDAWPRSEDLALGQIAYHLEATTDDMSERRLDVERTSPQLIELYERTVFPLCQRG